MNEITGKLEFSYDREADVLYIHRESGAVKAMSIEMDNGVLIRIKPDTQDIVGITWIDFKRRVNDKLKEIQETEDIERIGREFFRAIGFV